MVDQDQPGSRKLINDLGALTARVLGEALRGAGVDSGGAEPWAFGIIGMVDLATAAWLERKTMSRADLVAYLTSLLWDGLAANGLGRTSALDVTAIKQKTAMPSRPARQKPA